MGFHQTTMHKTGKGSFHQIGLVRGQFGNVPEAKWIPFLHESGFDGWEEAAWDLCRRHGGSGWAASELQWNLFYWSDLRGIRFCCKAAALLAFTLHRNLIEQLRRLLAKLNALAKFSRYLAHSVAAPKTLHVGLSFGGHFVTANGSVPLLIATFRQIGILRLNSNPPTQSALVIAFVSHPTLKPERHSHEPKDEAGDHPRPIAGDCRTADGVHVRVETLRVDHRTGPAPSSQACVELAIAA